MLPWLLPTGPSSIDLVKLLSNTATRIQSHATLHDFCTGRGTVAASLKAKLLQKLVDMMEEILYDIFLDLHKSYDTLDHDFCLNILLVYGVVSSALRLIQRYWGHLSMVARDDG